MVGKTKPGTPGAGRNIGTALAAFSLAVGAAPASAAKDAPAALSNPLATQDQAEAHRQALRLLQRPEVREAKANAEMRWRRIRRG